MGKKRKKKYGSAPRRFRFKRAQRIDHSRATGWYKRYSGKDIVKGYSNYFGCDKFTAALELRMLGIQIDESRIEKIRDLVYNKPKKKPKTPKIRKDRRGEYYLRQYFVRGKMKFERIYVVDGIPADEFYYRNADPITLLQDGEYEILHEMGF